jgi:hypothetical protein
MGKLGIQLHIVELVLNHVSGVFKGVLGIYQRHTFDAEKRNALDAWGRYVQQLVMGSPTTNLIAIAQAKRERQDA